MKVSIGLWVLGMIGLAWAMFGSKDSKRNYKRNFRKEVQSIYSDFE